LPTLSSSSYDTGIRDAFSSAVTTLHRLTVVAIAAGGWQGEPSR